jgi:hypothetical protein
MADFTQTALNSFLPDSIELDCLLMRARNSWPRLGLVAAWEAQSYLATLTLVTLLTLVSFWVALGVMLAWSLIGVLVYPAARRRGLPDLLEKDARPLTAGHPATRIVRVTWLLLRIWLTGVQSFAYSRCAGSVLSSQPANWYKRAGRLGVVGLGLTLFGITTSDHILRKAGFSGRGLRRASFLGPFLNVPYRLVLSAIVINTLLGLLGMLASGLSATPGAVA